ncbi:hypothetical protein AVEN_151138-1 [Araneus ventricosus]|uniref:Sushi domain-containing protein n=1 Tax=Araneus ventricosus TaxID=182803 RepID=A0A4Y2MLR6_ARAVE|nr:hypothetical protein AVEN_151138-1 [Araneus ventricosus]
MSCGLDDFLINILNCFMPPVAVPECEPPDYPQSGGYGPRQDVYLAGDVIHYYCDTDTYIGGNFYRRCEDTGDWIGNTPVCGKYTVAKCLTVGPWCKQSNTQDNGE